MTKKVLQSILAKYYLKGLINTVKWTIQDKVLSIDFQSSTDGIIGNVSYNDFPLENSQFVIYDTEQLLKLINILEEDITLSLYTLKTLAMRLHIEDSKFKQTYFLSDLMLAPKIGKVKEGVYDLDVDISSHIDNLIKAKEALPNSNNFIINVDKSIVKFTFGENNNFSNKVEYEIPHSTSGLKSFNLPFDSDLFKNVLQSNKDIAPDGGIMKINSSGLIKLSFSKNELNSEYYILRKS